MIFLKCLILFIYFLNLNWSSFHLIKLVFFQSYPLNLTQKYFIHYLDDNDQTNPNQPNNPNRPKPNGHDDLINVDPNNSNNNNNQPNDNNNDNIQPNQPNNNNNNNNNDDIQPNQPNNNNNNDNIPPNGNDNVPPNNNDNLNDNVDGDESCICVPYYQVRIFLRFIS